MKATSPPPPPASDNEISLLLREMVIRTHRCFIFVDITNTIAANISRMRRGFQFATKRTTNRAVIDIGYRHRALPLPPVSWPGLIIGSYEGPLVIDLAGHRRIYHGDFDNDLPAVTARGASRTRRKSCIGQSTARTCQIVAYKYSWRVASIKIAGSFLSFFLSPARSATKRFFSADR